jgi:hypothetical protein
MIDLEKPDEGEELPEKLAEYFANPRYERRVVVFCDVLGWRNHILEAGAQVAQIGALRRVIFQLSRTIKLRRRLNIKVSTFSDNIAVTQEVGEMTPVLIQQMANFQLASAMRGFFLRGGITIGDIVHDEESVFGPGLNRAYELESMVAKSARIVLDSETLKGFGELGDLAVAEDGVVFLDPFRSEYVEFLNRGAIENSRDVPRAAGLPAASKRHELKGHHILGLIRDNLKRQIRAPIADKEYEKAVWLFDRIATQLGVPRASSYPRVRPARNAD